MCEDGERGSRKKLETSLSIPEGGSRDHGLVGKMKSSYNAQVGVFITALADGAYTKVRSVDFGEKAPSRFQPVCLPLTMQRLRWRYVLTDWMDRCWQR